MSTDHETDGITVGIDLDGGKVIRRKAFGVCKERVECVGDDVPERSAPCGDPERVAREGRGADITH